MLTLTLNGHIITAEQNGLLYSNMVIGTPTVDGWAATFVIRGEASAG